MSSPAVDDTVADLSERTFSAADAVLAAKGRSFHWARHLLSPVHAARATRLYGFCRYIDDLADESTSADAARELLASASRSIGTGRSGNPVIIDALDLMGECRIDPAVVLELIRGVASDVEPVRMPDEATLLRYCYHVAGTVGLMMCRVLDVDDPAALPHAIDLGIGMQLSNICRDVAADAASNRRYLPASMIGELAPEALIDPGEPLQPLLRRCIAVLLDRADAYYSSGEAGLPYLPIGARSAILVAARLYRAIGTRLRRRDHAYWTGRAMVHIGAKTALTAHALLTAPVRPSFWSASQRHDDTLHAALTGLPYTVRPTGQSGLVGH